MNAGAKGALVNALVRYAREAETAAELIAERDALAQKLFNDGGEERVISSAGLNGKSFGWQVELSVAAKFSLFQEAIDIYEDRQVGGTYADFSGMGV